jgi:hypothetical protein
MKLTFVRVQDLYMIECSEADGSTHDRDSFPEGTSDEMRALADAIERRGSVRSVGCAVDARGNCDEVTLWNPMYRVPSLVTREEALSIAARIRSALGPGPRGARLERWTEEPSQRDPTRLDHVRLNTRARSTSPAAPSESSPSKEPRSMETYVHYNGGKYLLVGVAETHQHNGDRDAVYISLTHGKLVTRPWAQDSRKDDAWTDVVRWPDGVERPRFTRRDDLSEADMVDVSRALVAANVEAQVSKES